jgi:hypothetical protein
LKRQEILADLRRPSRFRERLEGYAISAVVHLLLLLFLASITLTAGGEGFGLGERGESPTVRLVVNDEAVDDAELEDLKEDVQVKPLEVEQIQQRAVSLPELASFSAPRPSSQRLANLDTRFTPTSGGVGGLSGQFGSFIGGLRKTGLDVVLVIDATASMQHVIDDIKTRSIALVSQIQSLVPIARIGVVAYRDRGDEFTTRFTDLSFHGSKIKGFLDNLRADGGGDYEEAVREGLETAMDDLSWRKRSKRVIIIVGSSPPHKEDIAAIDALADEFHKLGGVVSTIDVTRRMHEEYQREMNKWLYGSDKKGSEKMPEFYKEVQAAYSRIAKRGGGELAMLGSESALTQQILTFAFGTKWKNEVARYAEEN